MEWGNFSRDWGEEASSSYEESWEDETSASEIDGPVGLDAMDNLLSPSTHNSKRIDLDEIQANLIRQETRVNVGGRGRWFPTY